MNCYMHNVYFIFKLNDSSKCYEVLPNQQNPSSRDLGDSIDTHLALLHLLQRFLQRSLQRFLTSSSTSSPTTSLTFSPTFLPTLSLTSLPTSSPTLSPTSSPTSSLTLPTQTLPPTSHQRFLPLFLQHFPIVIDIVSTK